VVIARLGWLPLGWCRGAHLLGKMDLEGWDVVLNNAVDSTLKLEYVLQR